MRVVRVIAWLSALLVDGYAMFNIYRMAAGISAVVTASEAATSAGAIGVAMGVGMSVGFALIATFLTTCTAFAIDKLTRA